MEDLMRVDGIDEKTASQIVQFRLESRTYQKVADLMKVRGMKEKKFRKPRRYFCTDDAL